jgi:hypothetical protein
MIDAIALWGAYLCAASTLIVSVTADIQRCLNRIKPAEHHVMRRQERDSRCLFYGDAIERMLFEQRFSSSTIVLQSH